MFYFVFGINNSGTTVLCQYLAAQARAYLPPFGFNEGQFVPELVGMFRARPWAPGRQIDWPHVRAVWERYLREDGREIFVEGSPPNLMHVADIRAAFDGAFRGALLVSHPMLQIASCLKNYGSPPMDASQVQKFVKLWLRKARRQADNRARFPDLPFITYEAFCADPTLANAAFGVPHDPSAVQVQGKRRGGGAGDGRIRDMTARALGFLLPGEIEAIGAELSGAAGLLRGFGYAPLTVAEAEARLAAEPDLAEAGRRDRAAWEVKLRRAR